LGDFFWEKGERGGEKGEKGRSFFPPLFPRWRTNRRKEELTEISLFNPFSFTTDYTKEGEQRTFKRSILPFFHLQSVSAHIKKGSKKVSSFKFPPFSAL
jgi:hypothetical protein